MKTPAALTQNVLLLSLCQAFLFSGLSLIVATSALVGFSLAADKSYATLPFAAQLLAAMLTSIPAAALMSRVGRKRAFQLATLIAMTGGGLCTAAILDGSFILFLTGSVFLGVFTGFGNYYRFAAADSVAEPFRSRAISYVMVGGVIAAFVGPNMANVTQDVIGGAAFAGSYASLIVLYVLSLAALTMLRTPAAPAGNEDGAAGTGRRLRLIAAQPRFIVAVVSGALGYMIMSLVMSATPLAMRHHGHAFPDSAFVIQWHVLGMFAPSFFTGHIINRIGLVRTMSIGAMAALACVLINLSGREVSYFWVALTLLGVGWNFMFIGATTMLTTAYRPEERFKAQALNDFVVFSGVTIASLSAGVVHHRFGWEVVNYGALPAISLVLAALAWLVLTERRTAAVTGKAILTGAADGAKTHVIND